MKLLVPAIGRIQGMAAAAKACGLSSGAARLEKVFNSGSDGAASKRRASLLVAWRARSKDEVEEEDLRVTSVRDGSGRGV